MHVRWINGNGELANVPLFNLFSQNKIVIRASDDIEVVGVTVAIRISEGGARRREIWLGVSAIDLVYFTSTSMLSEWLLNSGAYMHWISAMPVWYRPLSCTRTEYSNTYTPFGRESMK